MKYNNFHFDKPELYQLIYWLGPNTNEVLGFFCGGTIFIEADGTQRGYYAKFWRPATEADKLLATWNPDKSIEQKTPKRKYTKKSDK